MIYEDFNYLAERVSSAWKFGLSKGQRDLLWEYYQRVDFLKARSRVEFLIRGERNCPSIAQLICGLVRFAPHETEVLEASFKVRQASSMRACPVCKGIPRKPSVDEYAALIDDDTRYLWDQVIKHSKVSGCSHCLPLCRDCRDTGLIESGMLCACLSGKIIKSRRKNHGDEKDSRNSE
jgi:hypothetical protein